MTEAREPPPRWQRVLLTLLVMIIAWLLWSGIYTPLMTGLGIISCIFCVYMAQRVRFFNRDVFSLHLSPRLPRYWAWLLLEIAKSSIDVARIILQRKMPISPTVVEFKPVTESPVGQAILGNSITLTPGSVTLDLHDGRLKVHTLTQAGADALLQGEIDRRVAALTKD